MWHTCRGSWLVSPLQKALFMAATAVDFSRPVLGRCGPWHRSTIGPHLCVVFPFSKMSNVCNIGTREYSFPGPHLWGT